MKVSHIVGIPSWYGTARGPGGGYFRDQAIALQSAGFRIAMLAPDIHTLRDLRRGSVPPERCGAVTYEDDGIPTYRYSKPVLVPRVPFRNAAAMTLGGLKLFAYYVARNGQPDLVHVHSMLNAGVVALAVKRRYGIPYIVAEQSTSFAQGTLRWWERSLVRRVVAGASRCIAVSPKLARLLEAQYPGSSWDYLPNPLGAAFLPSTGALDRPRTAAPFTFISVARMSPEKGFGLLIEAFADAFRGAPDTRLRLVGDGPIRDDLEALCRARGIGDQVDFVGVLPSPQVREEMEAADAFVLASDFETFGVVVIEALASGRPVIATASGGPDHIINAGNGLLIPTRNQPALREALIAMRRDAGNYNPRGIREEAISTYGPDAFARGFAELIA